MESRRVRVIALTLAVMLAVGVAVSLIVIYNNQTPEPTLLLAKTGQIDIGEAVAYVKVAGGIAHVIDQNEHTPGGLVLINVSDRSL